MGSPEDVGKGPMLVIGLGRMQAPGSGNSLDGGGTCAAGPWRRGWRSRSPRSNGGVYRGPAMLIRRGALMPRQPFQSSRGGLGQQPVSSLCLCSYPCAQALPSPASKVTSSLPQVLSPPFLPGSAPSPPPHQCLLTCSPSSSSWGLSASMPWRGETDGGGELGFGGGPEP